MNNEDILAVPVTFAPAAAPAAPPSPPVPKSTAEKLAELQKRKAEREKAEADKRTAAEVEALELEERFTEKLGGDIGKAFTIVDVSDLGEGFVVLKLGADVEWNTFKSSKMNVVDLDTFLAPNVVHPTLDAFRQLAKRRAFVPERCATALATLYGCKVAADAGK